MQQMDRDLTCGAVLQGIVHGFLCNPVQVGRRTIVIDIDTIGRSKHAFRAVSCLDLLGQPRERIAQTVSIDLDWHETTGENPE